MRPFCSTVQAKSRVKSKQNELQRSKYTAPALAPAADLSAATRGFLHRLDKLRSGASGSENELSRRLADVFEERGLVTVVDTSPRGTRKRPDILAYASPVDAELLLHADIAVESKLPSDLRSGAHIADALVTDYWEDKTYPYIQKNIAKIQYFIFTTFVDHAVVRITDQLRAKFVDAAKHPDRSTSQLREQVRAHTDIFLLGENTGSDLETATAARRRWVSWLDSHVARSKLQQIPLSTISNLRSVTTEQDIEGFATNLAEIAAGRDVSTSSRSVPIQGLFTSLRERVAPNYPQLPDEFGRDLRLFIMAQNAAADATAAEALLQKDMARWVDDFVAASIHSLVSRLFALKVIEDAYCVGQKRPLIEEHLWVVNTPAYNSLAAEALLATVAARMRNLARSKNSLVKSIAVFNAFFDWITDKIDPVVFRTLFELFVINDFRGLQSDLLGRFFEVYSQKINRSARRELGQYYTPMPVVKFMWWLAERELASTNRLMQVSVLDPSTGSGAFLREGAKRLAERGVPKFWERLTGFDISPQVLGIAQLNLYMSVLLRVPASRAFDVKDLKVYATDTLDPRNGKHLKAIAHLFPGVIQQEFLRRAELSAATKRDERFRLVIGNPPYKNNSALTLRDAASRFPRLLQSSAAIATSQMRYIRDDYAWFVAAADAYVQSQGMIVFVTSDSFLSHQSYRLFRRELWRHYHIRALVRLGALLFRDVGPNISFVISVFVRRDQPLAETPSASDCGEPVNYFDLRGLADGVDKSKLGTDEDPRLQALGEIATEQRLLDGAASVFPCEKNQYALLPLHQPVLQRVRSGGVPLSAKTGARVFTKKWPGIITAFDALFKHTDKEALGQRMSALFSLCHGEQGRRRQARLTDFAGELGLNAKESGRLQQVAEQISGEGMVFEPERVKRTFSGSIPNSRRWYPPPEYRHFVYYEPRLRIARNVHSQKRKGWGSMEQWREPRSHLISPKLVFTSSSNPQYGLKAFVLDDEWYVKLHGGKSQQYNYTGLAISDDVSGNVGLGTNLHESGASLCEKLAKVERDPTVLLHFLAGLYNSRLAEEFQSSESGQDFLVKVPATAKESKHAVQIGLVARMLRDAHRLLYDGPMEGSVEREELEAIACSAVLEALGLRAQTTGGGRFKVSQSYDLPADWRVRLTERIVEMQVRLDSLVNAFY